MQAPPIGQIPLIDSISFIASVASLVLSFVAIWLSFKFFQLSSQATDKTNEAATKIASNVEQLDDIFGRFYSDTFSVFRDTVSDMRRHVWPERSQRSDLEVRAVEKADAAIERLRTDLGGELTKIVDRQAGTDKQVESLKTELASVLERAIRESRRAEVQAREDSIRDEVRSLLTKALAAQTRLTARTFIARYAGTLDLEAVLRELQRMKQDGLIDYVGALDPDSEIMPKAILQERSGS